MITGWAVATVAASRDTEPAVITLRIRNTAQVPRQVLQRARQEAQRVFHEAGVEMEWLLCPSAWGEGEHEAGCDKPHGLTDLALGIMPRSLEKDFQVPDSAYGVTLFSLDGKPPSNAYVLHGRVRELVKTSKCPEATILAYVMVHEVGHLLLGRGHTMHGLMGAKWDVQTLLEAARGRLGFNSEQAQRLQAQVRVRAELNERVRLPAR